MASSKAFRRRTVRLRDTQFVRILPHNGSELIMAIGWHRAGGTRSEMALVRMTRAECRAVAAALTAAARRR